MKKASIALGCVLSFGAMAGNMGVAAVDSHPWSVIGSLGYTWFNGAYDGGLGLISQPAIDDGQTALGRFAIARDLYDFQMFHLGAEIGVQNGNFMRLGLPVGSLDLVGGSPVQATVKPMLDLLATFSLQAPEITPFFGQAKLGMAYRRMQINDRFTFNDLSECSFEVQGGLGMFISERATLSLNYQGVISGRTIYPISTTAFTGRVTNIPTQNGILLSLAYSV